MRGASNNPAHHPWSLHETVLKEQAQKIEMSKSTKKQKTESELYSSEDEEKKLSTSI